MRNRTLAARNIGFVPVPLAKRFPTGPQHEEVPWRSAFETLEQQQDSCSSHAKQHTSRTKHRIRAGAFSKAVPTGPQHEEVPSRARQVPHRSTTIFCNNFLGALPLTATRGRRINPHRPHLSFFWRLQMTTSPACGSTQAKHPRAVEWDVWSENIHVAILTHIMAQNDWPQKWTYGYMNSKELPYFCSQSGTLIFEPRVFLSHADLTVEAEVDPSTVRRATWL